jgi:hypothetical protein
VLTPCRGGTRQHIVGQGSNDQGIMSEHRQVDGTGAGDVKRPGSPTPVAERSDDRLLEILKLLLESGKVKSNADLLKYTQQAGSPEAVNRLREIIAEDLPLDLTFDALSVHVRIVSHKRNSVLLRGCDGKRVGLILPLPPHVIDTFLALSPTELQIMLPGGHHLPPTLERLHDRVQSDGRRCRELAGGLDVLVFEACRSGGGLLVDAAVADIADARFLGPSTRLIAHLRGHKNPDDVELHSGSHQVQVL